MKNTGFTFKQFTISQDRCAMKVCTDACLFGALIEVEEKHNAILDIGTGTGLLSLMMAQKTNKEIIAIEIDEQAYWQAKENFEQSNFKAQLSVYHSAIQDFEVDSQQQFDLIVSNPPFYQKSLQSPDNQVNKALHGITLSLPELLENVLRLLTIEGSFWVLLPEYESKLMETLATKAGLHVKKKINVRHDISKAIIRVILHFTKLPCNHYTEENLNIYDINTKKYSERFQALLKEYYIIF